jgi:hypothetical protein
MRFAQIGVQQHDLHLGVPLARLHDRDQRAMTS